MNFFKKIFGTVESPVKSYEEFWSWFLKNEKTFFKAVQSGKNIEADFFDKLSSRLNELKEGYYFLTGMYNDTTAELIFTADGDVSHFVFIEELVNAAPGLVNWKFTRFKPALDIEDVYIQTAGYEFSKDNLWFYTNVLAEYPDEVDITIVHNDIVQSNKPEITNGTHIFLDNFLGELNYATEIDMLSVKDKNETQQELVPIEKLKDYLNWRQKEFVEKYDGVRRSTEDDVYTSYEMKVQNGEMLIAVMNNSLLDWDAKASHPWMITLEIKYESNVNGMPDDDTYHLLDQVEKWIQTHLKDEEGYLNIGRQTGQGERIVYFACREFNKPSKVFYEVQSRFSGKLKIKYNVYKDKYWQTLNHFRKVH